MTFIGLSRMNNMDPKNIIHRDPKLLRPPLYGVSPLGL